MIKFEFAFVLVFSILINIFQNPIQAQEISIQRSALSISGANPQVSYQGKTYSLKQSIGQSGITGTNTSNNLIILQGYIQPDLIRKKSLKKTNPTSLNVDIRKLPHSDSYIITVNEEVGSMNLSIYNTLGQKKSSQIIQSNQSIYIDLGSYSLGCYIIVIQSNQKQYSTKLINN